MSTPKIYISIYDDYDYLRIPSICHQFIKQNNKNNLLINIVLENKIQYDLSATISEYKEYFKYETHIRFVSYNRDTPIRELIENLISKYKALVCLSNSCLYNSGFDRFVDEQINNNHSVIKILVNNNQNYPTLIYKNLQIIELIRNNITIDNFLNLIPSDNNCTINSNLVKILSIKPPIDIVNKVLPNPEMFYENNNCIFAFFQGTDQIVNSFVYINKNNKKLFNIEQNMVGLISSMSNDQISITWMVNIGDKIIQKSINYTKKYNGFYPN
jgi:hypothetical protein